MPDPHFNIPYMVGDSYRRDHTYLGSITPAEAAIGGLAARTLAVDLDTILALAWRVRVWTVSVGLWSVALTRTNQEGVFPDIGTTISTTTGSVTIPNFDVQISLDLSAGERTIINEQRNVIHPPSGALFTVLTNQGSLGNSSPANLSQDATFTYDSTPPELFDPPSGFESGTFSEAAGAGILLFDETRPFQALYFDTTSKLFYPDFVFNVGMTLHYGGTFSVNNILPISAASAGTLTVNPGIASSFVVPLRKTGSYSGFRGVPVGPVVITGGNITASMTATKFWPFKNSLGQAIFDEDSGAQINPNV